MDIKGGLIPLKKLFAGDRKVRLVMALGILGMLLLLASQCASTAKPGDAPMDGAPQAANEEYIQALEKKMGDLIDSVDGVGKARVMITLESSAQLVYATEEKSRTDRSQDISGEDKRKEQSSDDLQSNLVLVDRGSGQKQPLVTTQIEPAVKGVVVVCPGADNKVVGARIVEVVTTALGIGANRVCVVKGGAQ